MKVPGSDGSGDAIKRVHDSRVGDPSVNRREVAEKAATAGVGDSLAAELTKPQSDKVTVSSLGSSLGQQLDPAKMAEERKAKIAALKEQIRSGTYAPPSDAVAQSVSEEISLEIMFSGGALQEGDQG